MDCSSLSYQLLFVVIEKGFPMEGGEFIEAQEISREINIDNAIRTANRYVIEEKFPLETIILVIAFCNQANMKSQVLRLIPLIKFISPISIKFLLINPKKKKYFTY